MKTIELKKRSLYSKLALGLMMSLLPMSTFSEIYVQPIIQGKVVKHWEVNLKTLPKPKQVIKGGEDECNGGNFPDQYRYQDLTLLDNGQVKEVIINGSNGLIFHKERIVEKMNQQKFKKKFKAVLYSKDETNPNVLSADLASDGNDSIDFIFKSGQLYKYQLNFDNC
ncbi:hypothetical protein [Acinetobacter shaoyimingii]|uniref:Uncharacterized protein n=1 Tax=Acinetobacter shaoyimingii TaxID=2715164 RepID=A0A6G8RTG7_9GAMM|nr:hypothetical protein [Acinetobacter shaoyimingii]NHB58872.1 hypothetical protein [Acinetobacter shaoyimingii]QIO05259.1 hypothetical protein G8E00_04415 [Acinetobacter shaoyimingii]